MITSIQQRPFHLLIRNNLEELMVEPLLKWSVLSGEFNNFLGNYTSPERTNWRYLAFTVHRNLLDKLITQ